MTKKTKSLRLCAALLALALLSSCSGPGRAPAVIVRPGGPAVQPEAPGKGPHTAASVTQATPWAAASGWLKLVFDEASGTVVVRTYDDNNAQWYTLPQSKATPQSNAGFCALEADVIVNGRRVTLNTQDHAAAFGQVKSKPLKDSAGVSTGVQAEYLLCPNAQTAAKKSFAKTDTAFLVRVQYVLENGNFFAEASWENASGNPDAFIETIGFMERFGALRSPGPDDFLLLPDGVGALLYPGRTVPGTAKNETQDLRFAVYGGDPGTGEAAQPLRAHTAVYGVKHGASAFAALVEKGAALCTVAARQEIPGEVRQSSVGPRFAITPTNTGKDGAIRRAATSYGEKPGETLRIGYRFFFGESANFNTMATACREQLINIGTLSSTKSVQNPGGALPLNLTLLCTGPSGGRGTKRLTTFEQAQDIVQRLKNKGVDTMNVRLQGALTGGWRQAAPERIAPLLRLGGKRRLEELQAYCKSKGLALFPDVLAYPAAGGRAAQARSLTGQPMAVSPLQGSAVWQKDETRAPATPLRAAPRVSQAARAILRRLNTLGTAGVCLGDLGALLYTDYGAAGATRDQAAKQLEASLPSLSAQWQVMLDTGLFHAARTADVVVNLPLNTQITMRGQRYQAVPLLPMLLHGTADYSGAPLNLRQDDPMAFFRALSYGACPALTLSAAAHGKAGQDLYFESHLDYAVQFYARANEALAELRGLRITRYTFDPEMNVSVTTFGDSAQLYVNFSNTPVTMNDITIPATGFLRIG